MLHCLLIFIGKQWNLSSFNKLFICECKRILSPLPTFRIRRRSLLASENVYVPILIHCVWNKIEEINMVNNSVNSLIYVLGRRLLPKLKTIAVAGFKVEMGNFDRVYYLRVSNVRIFLDFKIIKTCHKIRWTLFSLRPGKMFITFRN